jgi:aquaporin TIP
MRDSWPRVALVELVGTFGLVLFSAGVVCVNQMTTPGTPEPGTATLTTHQPGAFGIALAQGASLAVLLALTVPVSGGYLNPAVTITLWAFGRMDSARAGVLFVAQLLGSVLAATVLRFVFHMDVLQAAHFGTPHINPLAYPGSLMQSTVLAGSGIELLLTFFLVFAMFAPIGTAGDPARIRFAPGLVQTAAALFGFALTGAALNPARWFGPVLWEWGNQRFGDPSPWADFLVYLSGPILGSLLAGLFCVRVYPATIEPPAGPTGPAAPPKATGTRRA